MLQVNTTDTHVISHLIQTTRSLLIEFPGDFFCKYVRAAQAGKGAIAENSSDSEFPAQTEAWQAHQPAVWHSFGVECCKMDYLHAVDLGVAADFMGSLFYFVTMIKTAESTIQALYRLTRLCLNKPAALQLVRFLVSEAAVQCIF